MGSKNKIAKLILPILNSERKNSTWVEPFVGGANMIDKASGDRIGNDTHFYLIELLKAVRDGWRPPENITKEEYYKIKENEKDFPPELVGFAGFLCSFGGKWWGGFAKNSKNDNYAARGSRCLIKQSKNLQGVNFFYGSYLDLVIPANSLIYCDPPYEGTTKYANKFNHDEFWEWCRKQKENGHKIFISEYNAPKDFKCLLEVELKTTLDKNSQYSRLEKLFTL
jgi:DNA adenine methylase